MMEMLLGFSATTWVIGALIALVIYWLFTGVKYHYWKVRNVPGDNPFISIKSMAKLMKGIPLFKVDEIQYKKHGRIYGAYFGRTPMVMLSDPDLLRLIFVKEFHTFPDRRTFSSGKVLGKMLSTLNGEDWKRMRTITTPVFTSGKLRRLALLITKSGDDVANCFLKSADENIPVEVKRLFGAFTLDVIASTAFGTDLNSINNPDNIFVTHARKVFNFGFSGKLLFFALAPKLFEKLGFQLLDTKIVDFFSNVVMEIRERRLKEGKGRDDFLQMLMDCESETSNDLNDGHMDADEENSIKPQKSFKKTLTMDELVAQCVLFFLAGYDTTATTISLAAYNLALNPECQEILLKEIDEAWEKHGKFDYDVVMNMQYLDAVISESLRMYPPGTRIERRCVEDYQLGDTGITIPKGMYVNVPVYAMHRDPEFFPDPEKFNPERFLPENKDLIKPYTYLPFGAGPRNCVAMRFALMEVKLCLVTVLHKISFHTCSETKVPLEYFNGGGLIQPKAVTLLPKRR